ncbi:hypothetical protein Vadar_031333 [Vaccinium darrowii]|uniref:Uncharacterized protein n=1 Tax=Vaccinium darrowii TaxID=229202 RepID=A0ACB7XLZ0_9ERIC|nr:hypothetical protein Vadar_031333 [Vaccinium darrowii]
MAGNWVCLSPISRRGGCVGSHKRLHIFVDFAEGMANPLYFDIIVHVYGKITEIKNIDPNRYSYIDLLDDITERSLSGLPCNRDCAITLSFQVPGFNEKVVVGCDLDVLDMFRFYSRTCLVDLFVKLGDGTGLGDFTTPIGPQVDVNGTEFVHEDHSSPNLWGDDFFGVESAYELNSDGLSSYQSDDEGGRESSDDEGSGSESKAIDSSTFGHEFYVEGEGPIKLEKGEHTCLSSTTSVEANSTWIAKKFASTLRTNPTMTLDAMQVEVQQRFGIEASKIQLHRAKRKAMEEIEGNHGTSYATLPTYAAEVRKSNLGSLVKIQCCRVTP